MVYCFHYHYRLPSETTGRADEPIRSTPLDKAMKKTPEKKMTKPNRPANAQRIRRILILSYLVINSGMNDVAFDVVQSKIMLLLQKRGV